MANETIRISKRGDDGFKTISVRLNAGTLQKIDEAAGKTNRSRNELINILLGRAVEIMEIEN